MDVGNSSVRGFLPNKVAAKMGDTRLTVGMVLVCQVRGEEGGFENMDYKYNFFILKGGPGETEIKTPDLKKKFQQKAKARKIFNFFFIFLLSGSG